MKRRLRGILMVMLSLALIGAFAPSLTGQTASAVATIGTVAITNIDAPVSGMKPDYSGTISVGGAQCQFQNLNGDYYKNGIGWIDETAGGIIKTTDTFINGHVYTVIVSLDAKSGFQFNTSGDTVLTNGSINGGKATGKYFTNTRIEMRYTFPKAERIRVSSVTITGVTPPKVGSTPTFKAKVSAVGAHISPDSGGFINGVFWVDVTADKAMKTTDRFEAGHVYKVVVSLTADTGYTLGIRETLAPATINGNPTTDVTYYTNGDRGFSYTFMPEGVIPSVTITDLAAPEIGKTPDYYITFGPSDKVTIDTFSSDAWKVGVNWYDVTASAPVKTTDKFIEGHKYRVRVSLYAKSGWSFCDGTGKVATTGTINGLKAGTYFYSKTNLGFDYTFPALDKTVKTVAITGLDAPQIGRKPDYTVSISATGAKVEDYSSGAYHGGVAWFNATDGYTMMESGDTFERGKRYEVRIILIRNSGYAFNDGDGNIITNSTINGRAADEWFASESNRENLFISYEFGELKETVSSVTITGVDAPQIGKTPDYTVTVNGAGVKRDDVNDDMYWKNGVTWYDLTEDDMVEITDTFKAGHQYSVGVSLDSDTGYTMHNEANEVVTKGTINGNTARTSSYYGGTVSFSYTFPALAGVVNGAAITGIDAPVAGAKPDYTASGSGAGYQVESDYNSDTTWRNGVEWYDKTASAWLNADSDTFLAGHQYQVVVSLIAKSGYVFSTSSTATINGKGAELYSVWNSGNAGFAYTFDALPAADKPVPGVTITGVKAPVAGEKPSYDVTVTGEGFVKEDFSNESWVHGVVWSDMDSIDSMTPDDTFQSGHSYRIIVSLEPKAGYTFVNDDGAVVTPGTINGETVTQIYAYSDGTCGYGWIFPKLAEEEQIIASVTITGVKAPVAGEKPSYDVTVTGEGFDKEDFSNGPWVHGVIWADMETGENIFPDDTFQAGHSYRIGVSMKPKEGYTFVNDDGDVVVPGTINGETVTETYAYYDGTCAYRYTFPKLAEEGPTHLFPVDFVGFMEYSGGLFFVAGGDVVTDANGLVQDPNHPEIWYYCANGQVQLQYTGAAAYDGQWFYLKDGRLDTTYNGLVAYDGESFIVATGRLLTEYSGLVQDPNTRVWYFVAAGRVLKEYTGLQQYDGAWFYVVNGRLASEYSGPVEYDGATFNVVNGQVVA